MIDYEELKDEIRKSGKDFWDKECQSCLSSRNCCICHKTVGLSEISRSGIHIANNVRRGLRDGNIFLNIENKRLEDPEEILIELMKNPITVLTRRTEVRFSS